MSSSRFLEGPNGAGELLLKVVLAMSVNHPSSDLSDSLTFG
jgi:hypothetical protein